MDEKLPLPEVPEAPPEMPEAPLPEKPEAPESTESLLELANRLYDAATKMQRDADELMKAIRTEEPEPPAEKMTPEESDAASKAIIGL